jgi:hypothetical protein
MLRLHLIAPVSFINYSNLLHGHSHIMFLGWVFNVLYIGFVSNYMLVSKMKAFIRLFWILQIVTVGMLFSFPIQGYGVYSIALTTLHTLLSFVFIALFFINSQKDASPSLWFAKMSLILFVISAIGPFYLAYLMMTDPTNMLWRNYSIYFYLHFQYNGFFLFGTISLLLRMIEKYGADFSSSFILKGKWLAFATVPTYFLSVLFSNPGIIFNVIGGLAALAQVVLFTMILTVLQSKWHFIRYAFPKYTRPFIVIAFVSLGIKFFLQLVSAVPAAAQLAFDLRPVVIAYLHLVLVGVITLNLLVWYHSTAKFRVKTNMIFIIFTLSFFLMELTLVAMPWWTIENVLPSPMFLLFVIAVVLSICVFFWLLAFLPPRRKIPEENIRVPQSTSNLDQE